MAHTRAVRLGAGHAASGKSVRCFVDRIGSASDLPCAQVAHLGPWDDSHRTRWTAHQDASECIARCFFPATLSFPLVLLHMHRGDSSRRLSLVCRHPTYFATCMCRGAGKVGVRLWREASCSCVSLRIIDPSSSPRSSNASADSIISIPSLQYPRPECRRHTAIGTTSPCTAPSRTITF